MLFFIVWLVCLGLVLIYGSSIILKTRSGNSIKGRDFIIWWSSAAGFIWMTWLI